MTHRSTAQVVDDLRRGGRLVQCDAEVDPMLEMAEIQRRVYASGGPAVFFPRVLGTAFPCVSNLFGSLDQARYLFRDTLDTVRRLIELKIEPQAVLRRPWRYARLPLAALHTLPRRVRRGAITSRVCRLSDLPQIQSWPEDGGPFVTLPQVLTSQPGCPSDLMGVNLGMYRVQLSGNEYVPDREAGLHYQIHRGIGVHHAAALARGESLPVSVTVGGAPAMTVAAVMPLPEGLTELTFAGALAGHRIGMLAIDGQAPLYADADFAIQGHVHPRECKPEGPFGDHLGYYSLRHAFPVLRVERVYHRPGAVWPFTVVGRPPQEDTSFGALIHELTGPVIPSVIPGVRAVHAVDAAGVHPLLLAIGSERYMPFQTAQGPAEILTQAHAILGNGQLSLAKYLMIVNGADDPALDVHQTEAFFSHLLRRVDWRRDLHFQTRTTIDTLDYSGEGLNRGSKVVIAAAGPSIRELPTEISGDLILPQEFSEPRVVMPGVLCVQAPRYATAATGQAQHRQFCESLDGASPIHRFPWITLVDDSTFAAGRIENWLWTTFTRSNPAIDIDGVGAGEEHRHWGCTGPLVVDARIKPHHAPPLVEDPETVRKVDALASRGGPLARWL